MGCWFETDAITRMPIRDDERVVIIVPVLDTEKYGYYYSVTEGDWLHVSKFLLHVGFGTYDGYGSIKEMPDFDASQSPKEISLRTIFLKESTWLAIQNDAYMETNFREHIDLNKVQRESGRKYLPTVYKNQNDPFNGDDELWATYQKMVWFADINRIDLTSGLTFKGSQNTGPKEHTELIRKLIQEG